MKKKHWKILALILALALIFGICAFANSLVGNPVSKLLAERAAQKHLEEHYPQTDYYVERVGFNFKFVCYYAHIRSDSSMDTQFSLRIDMLGRVYLDTYDSVLSGFVTASRLDQEYRELTDQVFDSPAFPYTTDIGYGILEIHPREAMENPDITDIPDWAIVQESLILDHAYDPRELGAKAGLLVVYVDSEELSTETAAQILLDIRDAFDKANIPFRAIDFTLQYPLPEDGPRPDDFIGVADFAYEDIYEEGMVQRVEEADRALKAYYAEQDKEMEKILATAPTK